MQGVEGMSSSRDGKTQKLFTYLRSSPSVPRSVHLPILRAIEEETGKFVVWHIAETGENGYLRQPM